MNPDQILTLTLTISEINAVINGLAQLPFNQVVNLISKIKEQADPQVSVPAQGESA
jgi:hypothetical protein